MVKEADYIYVLKDGKVAEEGTPDELIAADGWFAELARQSGQGDAAGAHAVAVVAAPAEEEAEDDGEDED